MLRGQTGHLTSCESSVTAKGPSGLQNYLEEGPLASVSFSEPEVALLSMDSALNPAGHSGPEWALPGQAGEAEADKGALDKDGGIRPEHSLRAPGGECVLGRWSLGKARSQDSLTAPLCLGCP